MASCMIEGFAGQLSVVIGALRGICGSLGMGYLPHELLRMMQVHE